MHRFLSAIRAVTGWSRPSHDWLHSTSHGIYTSLCCVLCCCGRITSSLYIDVIYLSVFVSMTLRLGFQRRDPEWCKVPLSLSDKTSYCKISQSLEAVKFVFWIVRLLWNLTSTSATMMPMYLSNFKAMRQFKLPISRLLVFTKSYDKPS